MRRTIALDLTPMGFTQRSGLPGAASMKNNYLHMKKYAFIFCN
jgi:hypothetical protein